MRIRLLVIILILISSIKLGAQQSLFLVWDQQASTLIEVRSYAFEVYINGTITPTTGIVCNGAASPFICQVPFPTNLPTGVNVFTLKSVSPQGVTSQFSAPFPVTVPSVPSNLRTTKQ